MSVFKKDGESRPFALLTYQLCFSEAGIEIPETGIGKKEISQSRTVGISVPATGGGDC